MKREYTKPDIMFESFSLSTSIAGNCAVKTMLPNAGSCGLPFGGRVIFLNTIQGCTPGAFQSKGNDLICYDNPSETNNLFKS